MRACRPLLHLNVVAIEKGAFWLPSTTVYNIKGFLKLIKATD